MRAVGWWVGFSGRGNRKKLQRFPPRGLWIKQLYCSCKSSWKRHLPFIITRHTAFKSLHSSTVSPTYVGLSLKHSYLNLLFLILSFLGRKCESCYIVFLEPVVTGEYQSFSVWSCQGHCMLTLGSKMDRFQSESLCFLSLQWFIDRRWEFRWISSHLHIRRIYRFALFVFIHRYLLQSSPSNQIICFFFLLLTAFYIQTLRKILCLWSQTSFPGLKRRRFSCWTSGGRTLYSVRWKAASKIVTFSRRLHRRWQREATSDQWNSVRRGSNVWRSHSARRTGSFSVTSQAQLPSQSFVDQRVECSFDHSYDSSPEEAPSRRESFMRSCRVSYILLFLRRFPRSHLMWRRWWMKTMLITTCSLSALLHNQKKVWKNNSVVFKNRQFSLAQSWDVDMHKEESFFCALRETSRSNQEWQKTAWRRCIHLHAENRDIWECVQSDWQMGLEQTWKLIIFVTWSECQ